MRYLVTGGTGFIGGNIAQTLLANKHTVYVTGKEEKQIPPGAIFVGSDFSNLDWNLLGKLDAVFHEAANNDTTSKNREEMFETNVEKSKKLFEEAYAHGCRRIVYASSTAVYGNLPAPQREDGLTQPLNVYAESKLALDAYAMGFGQAHPDLRIVGLRYCNVYGPGEGEKGKRATMIYQLAQILKKGEQPKIFKWGEQLRDYIYVKDVVQANLLAATSPKNIVLNCGSGHATNFNDIISILNITLGTNFSPEYIENPYIGMYQVHTECDMSLAKATTGFVPEFTIEKGIRDYFASGKLV